MKSLVVYYSESGNTQKVALAMAPGLGVQAQKLENVCPEEAKDCDLTCIGTRYRATFDADLNQALAK